jgi:hypothetical protein
VESELVDHLACNDPEVRYKGHFLSLHGQRLLDCPCGDGFQVPFLA